MEKRKVFFNIKTGLLKRARKTPGFQSVLYGIVRLEKVF